MKNEKQKIKEEKEKKKKEEVGEKRRYQSYLNAHVV